MNSINVKKLLIKLTITLGILICSSHIFSELSIVQASTEEQATRTREQQVVYLSDIPYLPKLGNEETRVGWKTITMDQNLETNYNGGLISLIVNGKQKKFLKGISAHANSQVIFDVSKYVAQGFTKFTTYYGVDASRGANGNAVYFKVVSKTNDSEPWHEEFISTSDMKGNSEAGKMEIDLTGKKYIKLEAYGRRGITSSHACYADAKLSKADYVEGADKADFIKTVEEYDRILKEKYNTNKVNIVGDYEATLLKRHFVNIMEYDLLQEYVTLNQDNYDTIEWLMNNPENLRYYLLGGEPTGGYFNSIKVLTRLFKEHKNDFNDATEISEAGKTLLEQKQLNWSKTKGDLYKRMAITISLTHSSPIGLWMQSSAPENKSDAVVRYEQYKKMYNEGKFKATDSVDITPWFETYTIEEMRYVMHVMIDDEEVIWLNEYTQSKIDAEPNRVWSYLTPHPYMAYIWPNYGNDLYYSEENKDYFNDLFKVGDKKLWDYEITRGTLDYKLQKLWMNFRNKFNTGAVCGGISKTGHCIRGVNAIPSAVIGQPGHAAIIYYNRNSNGQGYWGIDNDVSGWTQSEKGERLPIGWGSDRWYRGTYNIPYIILSQEALNDYNNFVKAEEILMMADVYKDNGAKQEELYKEAIKVQSINLDAWTRLMKLYLEDTTKTEEQYYNLAKEMMESFKCYPFTMYDLANKIKPKFTSIEYKFKYQILETRLLTEGKNYPNENSEVLQPNVTRLLASHLLGRTDSNLAKFSFDGEDAGKIVLSDRFDGNGIRWDYSIDGKNTWKEVSFTDHEEHKLQLTKEELGSITAENDIYVHIVGVNYNEENLYKIDILESAGLPNNLYASDLENRVVGVNLSVEWRYSDSEPWTPYSKSSPNLTGDKTVQLRQGATGTRLAGQASTFSFTTDNQPDTRKYIPVSHLTIHSVSTQATNNAGAATNAIDANYNTRWHSAWNGTDTQREIVIKLDKSVSLSAVEFVPAGGGNGKILDGTIYGSMDGENWQELSSLKNLTYTNQANTIEDAIKNTKSFDIKEPKEVQYIKIVANRATNGNWFTARAFNLYQDITKNPHPTAGIAYSTTEPTNGNVIARLVNPSTEITITNNGGKDTYTFTENGEFTFEFKDKKGITGSAVAKVNWIDKDIPSAEIKYKLDADKKLLILLDDISEDVYLLDKHNNKTNFIEVNANKKVTNISYLDSNGKVYKVLDIDEEGHTKKVTYKNNTNEVTSVETYVTTLENGVVTNEEYFDNNGNSIQTLTDKEKETLRKLQQTTSNPLEYIFAESGNYEFKILDKADNIAYKSIKVDYIENNTTILASDITYDITKLTNKNVVATIKPYIIDTNGKNVNVEIVNNNKKANYTFTKNGEFTFEYKDAEDKNNSEVKQHTAKVSWIDKIAPTAKIKYSTQEPTNKVVVATLVNESEPITITNNGSTRDYTFTENGEFTFEFEDKAGNKGIATAKVNWIEKEKDPEEEHPEDKKGDINKDGKITATDILLLKRHLVAGKKQEWVLTGDKFKAGDINGDGKITATDLVLIKRLVLSQTKE